MTHDEARTLSAEGEALRRAIRKRIRKMHAIPYHQAKAKSGGK
jgi:hypothetical protein